MHALMGMPDCGRGTALPLGHNVRTQTLDRRLKVEPGHDLRSASSPAYGPTAPLGHCRRTSRQARYVQSHEFRAMPGDCGAGLS